MDKTLEELKQVREQTIKAKEQTIITFVSNTILPKLEEQYKEGKDSIVVYTNRHSDEIKGLKDKGIGEVLDKFFLSTQFHLKELVDKVWVSFDYDDGPGCSSADYLVVKMDVKEPSRL